MINGMSECTHFEKSCCVYILHGVAAYILGGVIKNFWEFEVTLSADKFEKYTGSSCLMRISLLRFFKTITKIWLMRFYGLFILLLRT